MPDHYGNLADALVYHEVRGNSAWVDEGKTDAQRTAALVRASQVLDAEYGSRYPGEVTDPAQDLLWPRTGVTWRGAELDDDAVPAPIVRATYELALRELVSPNSVAPDVAAGPQKVLTEVKGIKWTVVGGAGAQRATLPIVDGILDELLVPEPGKTSVTMLARV